MTDKLMQLLLDYTRTCVDAEVKKSRVQAGRGVTLTGKGVRVEAQSSRTTVNDQLREIRQASERTLEVIGSKCYVNFPPVQGLAPQLQGRSIYAWPRPFIQVQTAPVAVYVKWAFVRAAMLVQRANEEDPAVIAGLRIERVQVTIETRPVDEPPQNVSPTGGDGQVPPYPGDYETWIYLGEVSAEGVVNGYIPPVGGQGGLHEGTVAGYNSEDGRWSFGRTILYP